MQIAPFSFREFGEGDIEVSTQTPRPFLPHNRKKEEAAPPAPPPPPVFSEADLKMAERDGFQKGFIDGMEEGKRNAHNEQADIHATLQATIEGFVKHLAPLFANYRSGVRALAKDTPELALVIAKKVAGNALNENGAAMIAEITTRCIETLIDEPKIIVTVHSSLEETLKTMLSELTEKLRVAGDIIVVGDAHIAPPNCRIEWKNGAMHRDAEQLWQHIEQIVDGMKVSKQHESEKACDKQEETFINPVSADKPLPETSGDETTPPTQ